MHTKDSHCHLDADDNCTECGVSHADECHDCAGRGFHEPACPESDEPEIVGLARIAADIAADLEATGRTESESTLLSFIVDNYYWVGIPNHVI
jgi:hypothetical protein